MTDKRTTKADAVVDAAAQPPAEPPQVPAPNPPAAPSAKIQKVGDWHLVTHESWQISVAPDGLMMLPRHIHPDDWDDFVRCGAHAKELCKDVIVRNEEAGAQDDRSLASRSAVVTHGPPPPGTVRMRTTQQQRASSIGRVKGRDTGRAPDAPPPRSTRRNPQ